MVAGEHNGRRTSRSLLVGVGLDNDDGHTRITRGQDFRLFGGSADTHEQMQEKAIKFGEKLSERGLRLDDVTPNQFLDVAHEVGMMVSPDNEPKEDK